MSGSPTPISPVADGDAPHRHRAALARRHGRGGVDPESAERSCIRPGGAGRLQQVGLLATLALRNVRLAEQAGNAQRRGLDSLTQMSRHVASSVEPATFFEKMSETVAAS